MRIAGRRYRDEWLPNYYPSKRFSDRYVRISRTGNVIFLTAAEDAQVDDFFMTEDLFDRLQNGGHIVTAQNSANVLNDLATWLKGTYDGPGLHIVVPTRRCNLNCTYCHMYPQPITASAAETDLSEDLIPKIAQFIMSSPRPKISVEFQGGEPFLNFPAIVSMVRELNRLNETAAKQLVFSVVSNLMVVTDEHLSFCVENGIKISYSLNGPQHLHDLFRITRSGSGSHEVVIKKVNSIRRQYPNLLGAYPLTVVTEDNMEHLIELADYYFDLGFTELGLIHLKNLGNARGSVTFNMHSFIPFYYALLEHIYQKNKNLAGSCFTERIVKTAITKILSPTNPLFVDWRNPIGYLSNCIIYDTDGEILPVDEARSLRNTFSLGNVTSHTYDEIIRAPASFETINLSIRDREPLCRECTYNPYCGVSPVLNFAKTGQMSPVPHVNDECVLILAVFDWVFKKLLEDDPVPLLKMVPEYIDALKQHLNVRASEPETVGAEV